MKQRSTDQVPVDRLVPPESVASDRMAETSLVSLQKIMESLKALGLLLRELQRRREAFSLSGDPAVAGRTA